jgi:aspartate carbamoyltransferase catalytic subunit
MFPDNKFVFISTNELGMPAYIKDIIKANGSSYKEIHTLEEAIGNLDVLYMTRIQQERFASEEEYLAQKNTYVLDKKKMLSARKDMIVMHPLPRVDEITVEVDDDERAMYFRQAKYGMYVRMALIMTILKEKKGSEILKGRVFGGVKCSNPKCITNHEEYLPKSFRSSGDETLLECEYCDERKLI